MLRRRSKKPDGQGERGQSIVEFAVLLPVLLLLLAAACDAGWVMLQYLRLGGMADTLARANAQASASAANAGLMLYAEKNYDDFDFSRLTISTTTSVDQTDYKEYVWEENLMGGMHYSVPMYYRTLNTQVELRYRVAFLTPMGKILFGTPDNELEISAEAEAERVLENESDF